MHLGYRIGTLYRRRRVVMSEAATIKWQAEVDQGQVNRVSDYIVDDHRDAADPQPFINKLNYLCRLQMMSEQAATYHVEAFVGEGKRERIAGYNGVSILVQMRSSTIE